MKIGFALLIPTGLLFAWSAPWACQTYAEPDGGTGVINPNQDGGNGGRYTTDAGAPAVFIADAGMIGIAAADGGGVTVGSSADFVTDFAYASNWVDGTISRVLIQDDAGLPPYEQARYAGIVPEDNHCTPDNVTPSRTCIRISSPWTSSACGNQLKMHATGPWSQGSGGGLINSPSRTIVDRKGNVVVALRAPGGGCQAGMTRIINVGDHLNTCHVRCPNRAFLAANTPFTEGVPLPLAAGGTVTLLPSAPPAAIAATLTGTVTILPENVIAAGTSAAATYSCPGHSSTDETDPVNYDDCLDFSIALGDPHPDPNADPPLASNGNQPLTRGSSFGRAAAISPNCNPASAECDTFIGMWNGATWVHLSNGANPPLHLFDVVAVDNIGISPYGGAVDCAGLLWSQGFSGITATTTIPLVLPTALPDGGTTIAPDVVIASVPNSSECYGYGIATDVNERVWIGGWQGANASFAHVCEFNAEQLVKDFPLALDAGWSNPQLQADVISGWQSYHVPSAGTAYWGRGVNTDLANNVYVGLYNGGGGASAASINPDPTTAPSGAHISPCTRSPGTSGPCVDKNGNPAPNGFLNWSVVEPAGTYGNGTIGIDLDDENNVWIGQSSGAADGLGTAVRLNWQTGAPLASVPVGSGLYSYSDFTGYALRHITLSSSNYSQTFTGCGVSPELTTWNAIGFTSALPSGTDLEFSVTVTNANDPTTLANAQPYPVCGSVNAGCGQGVATTGGNIQLPTNLPQGTYLTVYATLVPKICSLGGGGLATGKPILYSLTSTQTCAGD